MKASRIAALAISVLSVSLAQAQIVTIQGSDLIKNSRTTLNSNFSFLNNLLGTGLVQFTGPTAPRAFTLPDAAATIVTSANLGTGLVMSGVNLGVNFAVAASLDTLHQAILVCTSSNGTYAYTCATPNKTIASLTAGQMVLLKADVTNSGAPTLAIDSINGGTPYSITTSSGSTAPSNGTILAGTQGINLLTFNGTVFTLPPSAIAGLTTATDVSGVEYVAGSGTAQAQTATLTPAISGYSNGLEVCWKPTAANTAAAPTLSVNGLTATAVTKLGSTALIANDIVTTAIACARYNSSGPRFELQNPQTNSGAGGSPAYTAVTFSATPTFTISGTNPNTFYMSLSGNVTSFTVSGGTAGQHMTLIWNQDATGAHTVACPMNVLGCFAVGLTSNKNNAQDYVYSSDASAWIADSVGVINQ